MEINRAEMEAWFRAALERGILSSASSSADISAEILDADKLTHAEELVYPSSVRKVDNAILAMLKMKSCAALGVFGASGAACDDARSSGLRFEGMPAEGKVDLLVCPLSHGNAEKIRKILPYTAPSSLSGIKATFGVGDRLGIASPGHIRLFKDLYSKTRSTAGRGVAGRGAVECAPVLAQQSVRELTLMNRTYEDVLDSATWAVFQEGFTTPWGADGDHLKTADWVEKCLKIGFTMITADVSDYIHGEFASLAADRILSEYENKIDSSARQRLENRYLGLNLELETGEVISFSREDLARVILIYGEAVAYAEELFVAGQRTGRDFDFELSIDETDTATLAQAHVFIAQEAIDAGVKLFSVAPRFVGQFQKGIDYIGDQAEFDVSFRTHAAIARHFGYRISVHSGSDKFTVFPYVGIHTDLKFHLKTAGTSWLQALLVVSQKEPAFFRRLYGRAREVFPEARKYYHITPDLTNLPDLDGMHDKELPSVFENSDARQVLHVTYGELFKDSEFKADFYSLLNASIEDYWISLIDHIGRHLAYLGLKK